MKRCAENGENGRRKVRDNSGIGRRRFFTTAAALGGAAAVGGTLTGQAAAAGRGTAAGQGAAAGQETVAAKLAPVTVTPADAQYGELVHGMNNRYVGSPESVQLVDDVSQVAGVVQAAVTAGKRLTVRSGGHCLEDFVFNPEVQVVLDLSQLNKVYYDTKRRAFAVETGAQLLDVYTLLYQVYGVTVPGGICYSVAAGGHVSGGGWGLLCRQLGLIIDYLCAVEVVVVGADGKVRTIVATDEPDDPHRELWWAHAGGGGGNFGVVTRYWFRTPGATGNDPAKLLPKPPREVYLVAQAWPWESMTEAKFSRLVQNYARWFTAHSDPGAPELALASFLVLTHRSNGQIAMVTQVDATVPQARRLLDDYLAAIGDGVDVPTGAVTRGFAEFGPMAAYAEPRKLRWLEATRYLGTTNTNLTDPTYRQEYKSAYMRAAFPDRQLAALYKNLTSTEAALPGASITLSSYGGEVNRVAPSATGYPHRESFFKMMWMSLWNDPAEDAAYIAWNRRCYAQVYADTGGVPVPNGVTDGCYVNYPDNDLNDPKINTSSTPWYSLYYKDNYPRLQQVKKKYDPKDFFRHAQSVRLP
ncbi:FAD/FMN-containing dehydrogenase [Streptomyces prasinopilosus]|uniref:FAD/FMN-containing dehydrogenase n=1 Tax=Streptomyces prasinopilosus TaxID=67344 RepID=A0A1G6LCB7_9ACTN|nr:FAD/FMN-containing dehydrogenase [Streptomyces prasinopilosus]